VRLFVSIGIPDEVRGLMSRVVAPFRNQSAAVKWEDTSKLHVTLKFIGEQDPSRVPDIVAALGASAEQTAFRVRYSKTGMFPDRKHPRVFWIGMVDPDERVGELHRSVERGLGSLGIEKENRPFHPHVTVGRATAGKVPTRLIEAWERVTLHTDFVQVSGFTLMKSELRPGGAVHTVVERFPFVPHDSE
jgi:2'-5' RNA ligase